jgi:tetraacyldisaccharide 4'-kinase
MDEAALNDLLSGRRHDAGARLLRAGLRIASQGYSAAMRLRNLAYDRKWLDVQRADVPVISLGNITTGGTGKTPMAAWLANWLLAENHRPGLLSRGYRSLAPSPDDARAPTPMSNRESAGSATPGNDEKLVLDRLCPGVPHLQQRDRVASARRLTSEFGCDVLILDDGFQHRRLHRDLDLVLIDALQPFGYEHVLPRGLLREPIAGLRRANLIVITRADQCPDSHRELLKKTLTAARDSAECVEIAFTPQRLVGLDGQIQRLEDLSAQRALAFCGIGNPHGFRKTLTTLSIPNEFQAYPDHYHYRSEDFDKLASVARSCSAEIALTTLKDLVKIPPHLWKGPPLFAVEIGVEFLSGQNLLTERLRQVIPSITIPDRVT